MLCAGSEADRWSVKSNKFGKEEKEGTQMKQIMFILIGLTLIFGLVACGGSSTPAPAGDAEAYTSPILVTSYDGALPVRNQLALGTLQLRGTANEVTPEQAAQLVTLWQALRSTSKSGGAAQVEINALLGQIEESMTSDQLAAIGDLQLTQADIQAWAKANGLTLGTGSGQPGSGQSLSPEARATRQAEEGRSPESGGGASVAIIDALVVYLESFQP
jgi:hypothetical protein